MGEYIVTAERHRVVTKTTENGETVRKSTIYKKGDTVNLSDDDARRLLRSGGVRKEGEEGSGVRGARLPNSAVPVTTGDRVESPAALSGQTAEEGLREATEPSPEAIAAHQAALAASAPEDGGADTPDDGYDDLDYGDLQRLARERDLETTGRKPVLIERLRAFDADQETEEDDEDDEEE